MQEGCRPEPNVGDIWLRLAGHCLQMFRTLVITLVASLRSIFTRFVKPARGGYRDVLVNVRINGYVTELQLHLKQIYEVRSLLIDATIVAFFAFALVAL